MANLAEIVVIEDARRVMKSPSSPTLGVREVAMARSEAHGVPITFVSPLPSLEITAAADESVVPAGRLWALVEVADRREEPPGTGPLLERTRTSIITAANAGNDVFVLVPRRGYAAVFRCRDCGTVRRCATCGSAVGPSSTCARCGTESGVCRECGADRWHGVGVGIGSAVDSLRRSLGDAVGPAGEDRQVTVGTERDLLASGSVSLGVAADIDAVALAPNYRAQEDALRLLVRLAQLIPKGRGNRCLVETSEPDQPAIEAFRSGRFDAFADEQLLLRRRSGLPPAGSVIAIEIEAEGPADEWVDTIRQHADVIGPAPVGKRLRWLIQGRDLEATRIALRPVVGRLRDGGARVRVDVDPIDL